MKNARQIPLILISAAIMIALSAFIARAQLKAEKQAPQQTPGSAVAELSPREPVGVKAGAILLSYPRGDDNNRIDAGSTFLVGAVPPGSSLVCNGQPVVVNAEGYFAHTVKLKYGKNDFVLAIAGQEQTLNLTVERPSPQPALSSAGFKILAGSLEPAQPLGVKPGDVVQFAARSTPDCQMSVQLAGRTIAMKPAFVRRGRGKSPGVNLGLDTAFGVTYQRSPAAVRDLYLGFYKIQAGDNFQKATPVFVLKKAKKTLKESGRGTITVVSQPIILQTAHDNTIVRLGPGAARTTPLPQGVRILADGFKGEWWRLELCPNRHVWIAREDMAAEEDSRALPESRVTTINLGSDAYGAVVRVPLNQRLPYRIDQDLNGRKLQLSIFGVTADTDFVTGDLHPGAGVSPAKKLIDFVSWKQKNDLHYELTVQLNYLQQWGFWSEYQDRTLVLHIKSAPAIDPSSSSLKGAVICIDPGHGGREVGSIGCSGMKEATLNLQIADRVRKHLEDLGASVVMTRTGDYTVSLQERVDRAIASRSDLLVSIHNNALPDGRDPLQEHGTSSYWYHPQSHELAAFLQKNLVQDCDLKDYSCRYQNLFLCRPGQMPAVLLEIGFMINPDEFARMTKPEFQETAARSIAGGIKKYLLAKVKAEHQAEQQPDS